MSTLPPAAACRKPARHSIAGAVKQIRRLNKLQSELANARNRALALAEELKHGAHRLASVLDSLPPTEVDESDYAPVIGNWHKIQCPFYAEHTPEEIVRG